VKGGIKVDRDAVKDSNSDDTLTQKIKKGTIDQNGIHEELSREFATLGDRKQAMIDLYRSTEK
jgi:hypothetical protein